MRTPIPIAIILSVAGYLGCSHFDNSSSKLHLPPGDAERGKTAFVAHKCHTCHEVSGSGLPVPTVKPPVPVALDRECERKLSDSYLAASIMKPNEKLANYPKEQITFRGHTRMPEYADELTMPELADIVAFLQQERH